MSRECFSWSWNKGLILFQWILALAHPSLWMFSIVSSSMRLFLAWRLKITKSGLACINVDFDALRSLVALADWQRLQLNVRFQNWASSFFSFALLGGEFLWNRLFGVFEKSWIRPLNLHNSLLTKFRGFSSCNRKDANVSVYAVSWCICLERNSRIFNESFWALDFIRVVTLLASFVLHP